jgi:predicted MFS family arabinose efflux permease
MLFRREKNEKIPTEEYKKSHSAKTTVSQLALRFVIIIGVVNLFADFTYEGARSVNGAFLASLGASAIVVGFVAGFGELIGYSLRSITGFFASKTHQYWAFAFSGYAINVLAVPALALAGNWPVAAMLMIAERTGRAIRKPAVETMLSYSGKQIGSGWAFGLNEFFDQFGATVGPLVVALVLFLKGGYHEGYALLLVSALLCLGALVVARLSFPKPQELDKQQAVGLETKGFSRAYWLYVLAGGLIAAGFADFSLIAFHFQKTGSVPMEWIPILYAIAMAMAGVSSLAFGRLLDSVGFKSLLVALFIGAFSAMFVFLGGFTLAIIGMVLWGIGMGAQDSMLKAILSNMVSKEKRSTAFGVFDTGFGIAWFLGSAAMGIIYTKSIPALIVLSVLLQLAALPVFILATRREVARSR